MTNLHLAIYILIFAVVMCVIVLAFAYREIGVWQLQYQLYKDYSDNLLKRIEKLKPKRAVNGQFAKKVMK